MQPELYQVCKDGITIVQVHQDERMEQGCCRVQLTGYCIGQI